MPFVLIIAGVVLIISAVRNTQQHLFYLLALDFTGPHNFIFWFVSILIIGALGYIPKAKPLSDGFLILVILVLFLKKGTGFFDQFQRQIGLTTTTRPQVSTTSTGGQSFAGGSSSISIGGIGGGITIGGGGGTNPSGNGGISNFPSGIGGGLPSGIGISGGGMGGNIFQFPCDPFFDPSCPGLMG